MSYIIQICFLMLVFFLQSIFPIIQFNFFNFSPDFLLILLTFYAFKNNRFHCILFGFTIGFFQDFLSQINLLGALAFSKSISGFMLGSLRKYLSFFSRKVILALISIVYLSHFSIFYFIRFNDIVFDLFLFLKIIGINYSINILIFLLLNKILFDSQFKE